MLLRSVLLFPSFVIRPADGDVILGALASTGLIFFISAAGKGDMTPLKVTLAGAVVAALLHSLSTGVAIYYDLSQDLAFWYAGGVSGIKWAHLQVLVPVIAVFIILATFMGRSVTLLSMGNDVAANLGVNTALTRAAGLMIAVVLAGVSVSSRRRDRLCRAGHSPYRAKDRRRYVQADYSDVRVTRRDSIDFG